MNMCDECPVCQDINCIHENPEALARLRDMQAEDDIDAEIERNLGEWVWS